MDFKDYESDVAHMWWLSQLQEAERKRAASDAESTKTPPPATRGSAHGDRAPQAARRTVTLYHAPEIRAVIHLTAAPIGIPSGGAAEGTEWGVTLRYRVL